MTELLSPDKAAGAKCISLLSLWMSPGFLPEGPVPFERFRLLPAGLMAFASIITGTSFLW